MDYEEVKRFRDGTVMIKTDGKLSIVDADLDIILKKKNWPAVVAKKLQKQFPHMTIEYVEDDIPGIAVEDANGTSRTFCNCDGMNSPEEIYASCQNVICTTEQAACDADQANII